MGPNDQAATLRFENVGLRFAGGPELLADLQLMLAPGEVALVTGARGAGKTLLAELATLERGPERGRVCLFGQDHARLTPGQAARLRRRIGYCAERPLLVPDLSAADNVAIPLRLAGVAQDEARADAVELIRWLGRAGIAERRAGLLSDGEARCVALARALVGRPAFAVLDEPVRAGEELLADRLAAIVARMRPQGTSFLILATDDHLAGLIEGTILLRLAGGRLEEVQRPVQKNAAAA